MDRHVIVLKRGYVDAILCGRKVVECRFMRRCKVPWGRVFAGDVVYFKVISGPILGKGRVGRVESFDGLDADGVLAIKKKYNGEILGADDFWAEQVGREYGVLIWLVDVEAIEPIWIDKTDRRGWVVLDEGEDFGLGCEI